MKKSAFLSVAISTLLLSSAAIAQMNGGDANSVTGMNDGSAPSGANDTTHTGNSPVNHSGSGMTASSANAGSYSSSSFSSRQHKHHRSASQSNSSQSN